MTEKTTTAPNSLPRHFRLNVILFIIIFLFMKLVAYTMCINLAIFLSTKDQIYKTSQLEEVPTYEYGLLLGTSAFLRNGHANPHFANRVEAAANLYHHGKIHKIITSGDPRPGRGNEVISMKKALIARGVPESDIIPDPKGLRTLASIQQTNATFGINEYLIISQEYHNFRAVYLAKALGMNVTAYSAQKVPFKDSFWTEIREIAARVKAIIDIFEIALKSYK